MVHRSSETPVEPVARAMPSSKTLGALIEEIADQYPDAEAVVATDGRLTYDQLRNQVRMAAKGLLQLGVSRGDMVAGWLPNWTGWVVANLAAAYIGGVFVAVNTWYRSHEMAYLLEHADVSTLVMSPGFRADEFQRVLTDLVPESADLTDLRQLTSEQFPALRHVVNVNGVAPWATHSWEDLVRGGESVTDDELHRASAAVHPDDPADLLYTSGSTARPKGVVLCHRGLIENGYNIGARQRIRDGDRLWLANPLFFSYGCANALMVTLTHGAALILQEVFDAEEALLLLEAEQCTVLYGTTNMVIAMTRQAAVSAHDLSSLRTGTAIGSPAHVQMRIDLGARSICNIYGLTETYGNCCVTDACDPEDVRLNSQGEPLPGTQIRIIDAESGRRLEAGSVGEICVRGYVMPGYHKDPEMNARAFDDDGFFHTGDLGWLDDAGRIHWQGRSTEMIKTGGINVAPSEVEEVLGQHEAVQDACVLGLPDETHDEIIAAVISPKEGHEITAGQLASFCRERLASYKVPRQIHLMDADEFPLTATGKVSRKELRSRLTADESSSTEGGAAPPASHGSQRAKEGP